LDVARTNRLLGTSLAADEIVQLLESIEIHTEMVSKEQIDARPPSFRVDIHQPEDLLEEIARLWGYNRITPRKPHVAADNVRSNRPLDLKKAIRFLLNGFGFTESINYSFISEQACDHLRLSPKDRRRAVVKILNPLTEDQNVMRTSLVPGLLETALRNIAQQTKNLKIFEIGKVFFSQGQDCQPDEHDILAALWSGVRHESAWNRQTAACDFYDIKGVLEGLFVGLQVKDSHFTRSQPHQAPYLHPGAAAEIFIGDQRIGSIGEIHREVLANFGVKQPAFIFEIDLDHLIPLIPERTQAAPLPRYPSTSRDITLIVDTDLDAQEVLSGIHQMKNELVETVGVFDVFKGHPIPQGKKSLSLRVVYRSSEGTLEDETINRIHRDLTRHLLEVCNADLPS
jgi:phenylalanyl-tRNA synthetase beta chain